MAFEPLAVELGLNLLLKLAAIHEKDGDLVAHVSGLVHMCGVALRSEGVLSCQLRQEGRPGGPREWRGLATFSFELLNCV